MFNEKHYVPILKWKRAEHRALKDISIANKGNVTPLAEVVLPMVSRFKDKEQKIKKTDEEMLSEMVAKYRGQRMQEIPREIRDFWGSDPLFLDFSLIHNGKDTTALKVESITVVIQAAIELGLRVIPVVNLNDEVEIKQAVRTFVKKYGRGVCLRVGTSDLINTDKLNTKLKVFVTEMGLGFVDIDLLVDLKTTPTGNEYAALFGSSQQINSIRSLRNFIFASGAFPIDLSQCKLDDPTMLPRRDWLNWLQQIPNSVSRKPTYADYTIRTPLFDESLQFHHATTSIKYTVGDGWYVMKGVKHGYSLFLANAKLLVENSGHFYGENFSAGDRNILLKARHYDAYIQDPSIKGTGRNEDWIAYGINHHFALVVHQLSSLGKKASHAPSREVSLGRK